MVYAYDASGQRVAQARVADANGVGTASAYVASGQVDDPDTASASTGDLSATRYYTFAGSTVAIRTNDNKLALMLGDEQGSTNVVLPVTVTAGGALASATLADAQSVTRTSYTPYGQLRGADNTAVDTGWLGQVEDRVDGASGTGLTYLNARYYDPATSRFISPDPLMNPGDPKTLDAYRYADNNPVVFTDASGLRSTCASSPGKEAACAGSAANKGVDYVTGSTKVVHSHAKPVTPAASLGPVSGQGQANGGGSMNGTPSCDWLCVGRRNAEYQTIVDNWPTGGGGGSQQDQKPVDRVPDEFASPSPSWADFWRGLRFFKNAGFLADPLGSAYGWGVYSAAKAGGADCGYYSQEAMMVCAGAPSWLYGRGGTMHSFVYVTGGAPAGDTRSDLDYVLAQTQELGHEAGHMDQFAIFGAVPFGLLYLGGNVSEGALGVVTGKSHPQQCQVFERWAGFPEGGYTECMAG